MKNTICGALFVSFSLAAFSPLFAQDPEKPTEAEGKLIKSMLKCTLNDLEVMVKAAVPRDAGNNEKQRVRALKNKIAIYKRDQLQTPEVFIWRLENDLVAYLRGGMSSTSQKKPVENYFKVFQVIDGENCLIEGSDNRVVDAAGYSRQAGEALVWVTGVSTSNMVDDKWYEFGQLFEVVGTKTYSTALGGSKTIFQVRPFEIQDIAPVKEKFLAWYKHQEKNQDKKEPAAVEPEKPKPATFREWTSGKYTVVAKFVSMLGSEVTLEKEDGKQIKVDVSILSEADRDFIDSKK